MMPIRAENRDRYPDDWGEISLAIKNRAGWRCECEGECGRGTHRGRCPNRHGYPAYGSGSTVILTTAHLDHVPEHVDPSNLKAMCQGCHLHYDKEHHARTRAETRLAAAAANGQLTLDGLDVPAPRQRDTVTGSVYADPGDRLAGRFDPPRLCTVLTQWRNGGGPRNVLVEYHDNGQRDVIPFSRRLRKTLPELTPTQAEKPA